jgi:predicted outer membrane repeat protein
LFCSNTSRRYGSALAASSNYQHVSTDVL